jgi:hypothetical protein
MEVGWVRPPGYEGLGKALIAFSHVSACHNTLNLALFYVVFNSKNSVFFRKSHFLLKTFA